MFFRLIPPVNFFSDPATGFFTSKQLVSNVFEIETSEVMYHDLKIALS
jgi:hypothetical protein